MIFLCKVVQHDLNGKVLATNVLQVNGHVEI